MNDTLNPITFQRHLDESDRSRTDRAEPRRGHRVGAAAGDGGTSGRLARILRRTGRAAAARA